MATNYGILKGAKMTYQHLCKNCGKDCDELTQITEYNGQEPTGFWCDDCHEEDK